LGGVRSRGRLTLPAARCDGGGCLGPWSVGPRCDAGGCLGPQVGVLVRVSWSAGGCLGPWSEGGCLGPWSGCLGPHGPNYSRRREWPERLLAHSANLRLLSAIEKLRYGAGKLHEKLRQATRHRSSAVDPSVALMDSQKDYLRSLNITPVGLLPSAPPSSPTVYVLRTTTQQTASDPSLNTVSR
jgi:hypothetical protein